MKINKLPNGTEFDKIVEDAFSSDEKHIFSADYEFKRDAIQRGAFMKTGRNHIKWQSFGMTAAAAAVVIGVPTGIFLASSKTAIDPAAQYKDTDTQYEEVSVPEETQQLAETTEETTEESSNRKGTYISDNVYQTGDYSYDIVYNPEQDENREFHQLTLNYIPDDFTEINEQNMKPGYNNIEGGTFEYFLHYIPNERDFIEHVFSCVSAQINDTDDKTVVILERYDDELRADHENFGRFGYVFFKGTRNVVEFYVTDDVSDETLNQIIAGMELAPSEEAEKDWVDTYDATASSSYSEPQPQALGREGLNLYQIGDSFGFGYGDEDEVKITVNDAWIQNDFEGITTDGIARYADYSEYIDDTGNFYADCYWMKYGDGKSEPFSTVAETETQHFNIVVVDFTYDNISDTDLTWDNYKALCINMEYFMLVDGVPTDTAKSADGLNAWYTEEVLHGDAGSFFSFSSPNQISKNEIDLPIGESTTVRMAFLVRDDLLGNLYLNVNQGSWRALNEDNIDKSPVIDLCNIRER